MESELNHQNLVSSICPACKHGIASIFFHPKAQPLANHGWPLDSEAAKLMPRLPMRFLQCVDCSHVWNDKFSYSEIPYVKNPSRMFNQGINWQGHLKKTRDLIFSRLPTCPTLIDIGCGDGHFVRGLAEVKNYEGRFIGFDPNVSEESGQGIEFYSKLFDPSRDIPIYAPDVLIIRHVLEHLTDPLDILNGAALAATIQEKPMWLFAEVPSIERVFETGRISDFFYEHFSHFTARSFKNVLGKVGQIEVFDEGYDREVIFGLVRLGIDDSKKEKIRLANSFNKRALKSQKDIKEDLKNLIYKKQKVVIWGGTGKAAAFINFFEVDSDRFPVVVDSDELKVGTYVPGTGQEIKSVATLESSKIDVVIVPTAWRSRDIIQEMKRKKIFASKVLIEHKGRLIDFLLDDHPYREV